ncbi:MAG: alpha-ketoglutarate-dependent dioxygenase AlkB [Ferruginibacter sp.]|nr:alpha-ketoglutarate-dependent dioxygenase AlkB [Ferruginibacter sp.]
MNPCDNEGEGVFSFRQEPVIFDLPDADISLYDDFFSTSESKMLFQNLLDKISWQQYDIRMFGRILNQPRLTAYYGDAQKPYAYSGLQLNPNPWNEDLLFIKSRIEAAAKVSFTSVLLNYYRDGKDSMGWHADDEKELGQNPVIGSVSFGETRPFQLRHLKRKEIKRVDIPLTNGSFLLMKGTTQHFWQHQIPKTTRTLGPRINLTFRVIH